MLPPRCLRREVNLVDRMTQAGVIEVATCHQGMTTAIEMAADVGIMLVTIAETVAIVLDEDPVEHAIEYPMYSVSSHSMKAFVRISFESSSSLTIPSDAEIVGPTVMLPRPFGTAEFNLDRLLSLGLASTVLPS